MGEAKLSRERMRGGRGPKSEMRVQESGNEEVRTWGSAERSCDLGAEDLGLTSALYELGSLRKGIYPL